MSGRKRRYDMHMDEVKEALPGAGTADERQAHMRVLPASVRRRVAALRGLDDQHTELERQYAEELEALNRKYLALKAPIYGRRLAIVNGRYEPGSEEVAGHLARYEGMATPGTPENAAMAGVPEFWYRALRNNDKIADLTGIGEHDRPALASLVDVRLELLESVLIDKADITVDDDEEDIPDKLYRNGFTLVFEFAPNQFFSDTVLRKTYYSLRSGLWERFEVATGDKPHWYPGKDLTVRMVRKTTGAGRGRGRGKKAGHQRFIEVEEPIPSFFHFFDPPQLPNEGDLMDPLVMQELFDVVEEDYDIGIEIRDHIIPHAIRWFTGEETVDVEDIEDEDDEDDDDDSDDSDSSDDDSDADGDSSDSDMEDDSRSKPAPSPMGGLSGSADNTPECKQQ